MQISCEKSDAKNIAKSSKLESKMEPSDEKQDPKTGRLKRATGPHGDGHLGAASGPLSGFPGCEEYTYIYIYKY